jgi:hypothetical protein
VDWGEIEDLSEVLRNQFTLEPTDTIGGRLGSMFKMSTVIILTNLRVILVEFLMMYFL